MSKQDARPVEARLEAAFDRFNRAVILGMEPTPFMFMDALEAEGLHLQLTVPDTLDEPAAAAPRTKHLAPRRARVPF